MQTTNKPLQSDPASPLTVGDVWVDGVKLHFTHFDGQGPLAGRRLPVLCIHGLSANQMAWGWYVQALRAAGHAVITYDLRGRGQSDKPHSAYGVKIHADDAASLLRQLGIGPVAIVGHSLGAMIGVELAARYPELVAKLVLVDGGGLIRLNDASKALDAILQSIKRLNRTFRSADDYVHRIQASPYFKLWNPVLDAYYRYELEYLPDGRVRSNVPPYVIEAEYQAMGGSLSPVTYWTNFFTNPHRHIQLAVQRTMIPYERVLCPTLIMQSRKDNMQPGDWILPDDTVDVMRSRMPNTKVIGYPDANHFTIQLAENPTRDADVTEFLAA